MVRGLLRGAYRSGVLVVGVLVVLVGIVLLPLPGPGMLVIVLGVTILASEFGWARRPLHRAKERLQAQTERWRRRRSRS